MSTKENQNRRNDVLTEIELADKRLREVLYTKVITRKLITSVLTELDDLKTLLHELYRSTPTE